MIGAISDGLLNLLDLFKLLIQRILMAFTHSQYALSTFKWIFAFLIAMSAVFWAIRLIKKTTWGK